MKDIAMNDSMTAPTATATSAVDARANASITSINQLVQALYEHADAQNRVADQLEKANEHLSDMSQMLYACLHSYSVSLDGIDRSLGKIAELIENVQTSLPAGRQPAPTTR